MMIDQQRSVAETGHSRLEELWSRLQIERVINAERNGKDLGLWEQMLAAYHPEAQMSLWFQGSAQDFVASSRASYEAGLRQVHLLGPMDIRIHGNRALAEFNIFIRAHIKVKGVAAVSHTSVRSYNRLAKGDGDWRIHAVNVVYQFSDVVPLNPWEQIDFDLDLLARYPASYRYVAHTQADWGINLRHDLLGIDNPEGVRQLVESSEVWLMAP
jgi:hypothetical protein